MTTAKIDKGDACPCRDMKSLAMQARDKASLPWYNVMGDCREVVRQWEKMYRSVHPVAAVPHPSAMRGWRGGMAEEAAEKRGRGRTGQTSRCPWFTTFFSTVAKGCWRLL